MFFVRYFEKREIFFCILLALPFVHAQVWDTVSGNLINDEVSLVMKNGTDMFITGYFTSVRNSDGSNLNVGRIVRWDSITQQFYDISFGKLCLLIHFQFYLTFFCFFFFFKGVSGGSYPNIRAIAINGSRIYVGGAFQ